MSHLEMLIKPHERVLNRSSQEERGDERNKSTARLQEPACHCLPVGCWHGGRSAGYWSERLKMNWENGKSREACLPFLVQSAAGTFFFPPLANQTPLCRSRLRFATDLTPSTTSCIVIFKQRAGGPLFQLS